MKTFWVFEGMPMTNGDAIAKNHEYFTTFHHGLELQLHDHGRNGHGLVKKSSGVLSTEMFWGVEFLSMGGTLFF
jgi:hypothetical protein